MAQPYISWSDVRGVLASVDAFDGKVNLNENAFVDATQDTLSDSGYIGRLFRDGVDLGTPEATAIAVDADGEWFYDSAADILYTFNTNASSTYEWMAAPDTLANLQAKYMNTGAGVMESNLDPRYPRPLPKSDRSYSGRDYEELVIKLASLFAAHEAIVASDPGSPELIKVDSQLRNEDETGLIDLINKGDLKFEFEKTDSDEQGEIVECSIDAATTGYPSETYGNANVEYAKLKLTIGTGGTITYGTANSTVNYTVTDGVGTEIVGSTLLDISQGQTLGYGVSVVWAEGVYTANDCWYIFIRQRPTTASIISSFDLSRV